VNPVHVLNIGGAKSVSQVESAHPASIGKKQGRISLMTRLRLSSFAAMPKQAAAGKAAKNPQIAMKNDWKQTFR